jgi:hypothetical protein
MRALLELVAREVSHPVGVRNVPKRLLAVLGLLSLMMRGLVEMGSHRCRVRRGHRVVG